MCCTAMAKVRSTVRPCAVTIRLVIPYFWPAVPPDSQIVAAVAVLPVLSSSSVMPGGTVHVEVEMVSPVGSHEAQSTW